MPTVRHTDLQPMRSSHRHADGHDPGGPGPRASIVVRVRHPLGAIALAIAALWLVNLASPPIDLTPGDRSPADEPATIRLTQAESLP